MDIEYAIFGTLVILFAILLLVFTYTSWGAVSVQKKHQPEMDDIRTQSIMWNH
jgi:hypothetical protein